MRVYPIKKHADSIRIQTCFCAQNDGFVSLTKEKRLSLTQCQKVLLLWIGWMLPSFLSRDLLVQYPTTVVVVVFLILVWRNTHDFLKIAVEGGNILISDPQSNLCHGIIGGIEQFIGFLNSYHRQIFNW